MSKNLKCLLVALALPTAGCNILAWPLYVFARPAPTRTVEPEFAALKNKTVAIVIYTTTNTQFEYPTAALELSDAIAAEMGKNVRGIQLVDLRRVIRYQDENPTWETMPPGKLCPVFSADYVLLVSVMEFSTREPGLGHLARGRLTAEAALYPPAPAGAAGASAWRTRPLRVIYPEESPLGIPAGEDWPIRLQVERIFADLLVKKFYKHQVPVEP
jgi:hypothetical protein